MVSNSSQYGWAHKVLLQNGTLFPHSKFPSSYLMLATLILEYFCIYNQETFKECYSDWLIGEPWFMACLIPPDFHWVVAWREHEIYSDFCRSPRITYFCHIPDSNLYSKHLFVLLIYWYILFVAQVWLVHGFWDLCHFWDTVATSSEVRRPLQAVQQEHSGFWWTIYFLVMQEPI